MATLQLGQYAGIVDAMTTELNSLAATSGKAISSAIDNSDIATGGYLFDDLVLEVTFGTAPTAGTVVEVYIIPAVDGTNYADGSSSILPQAALFVGGFVVRNVNTAQKLALRGVPLPPGLFKYLIQNTTNQAFPASGSKLRRNPYRIISV